MPERLAVALVGEHDHEHVLDRAAGPSVWSRRWWSLPRRSSPPVHACARLEATSSPAAASSLGRGGRRRPPARWRCPGSRGGVRAGAARTRNVCASSAVLAMVASPAARTRPRPIGAEREHAITAHRRHAWRRQPGVARAPERVAPTRSSRTVGAGAAPRPRSRIAAIRLAVARWQRPAASAAFKAVALVVRQARVAFRARVMWSRLPASGTKVLEPGRQVTILSLCTTCGYRPWGELG